MSIRFHVIRLGLALAACGLVTVPVTAGGNTKKIPAAIKGDDIQLTLSSKPYMQDPNAAYTRQICLPRKKPARKAKKAAN